MVAAAVALSLTGCGSSGGKPRNSVGLGCSSKPTRKSRGLGSSASCRASCEQDDGCHVWSYRADRDECELREYCETFTWGEAGVDVGWKPHLPQPVVCPKPEDKVCCPNETIKVLQTKTFDSCCDACHSTEGCLVFEYGGDNCNLKSGCPSKQYEDSCQDVQVGWMQRPGAASFPDKSASPYYQVGRGWFNVSGYSCGDGNPATAIWYPVGEGPFGVVVHRVGTGGQLDKMDEWFVTMASLGVVVVASFTDAGLCNNMCWKDMLLALQGAIEKGGSCQGCDSPPGRLDLHKVGFSGHSMGAKAAMSDSYLATRESNFAYARNISVKAVVAAHDLSDSLESIPEDVAVFVATGTNDWTMHFGKQINKTFHQLPSKAKVGASMVGAGHNEPGIYIDTGNGGRGNWWMSLFLACHLGPDAHQERNCAAVYGDGPGSMSRSQSWRTLLRQHPSYNSTQIQVEESPDVFLA